MNRFKMFSLKDEQTVFDSEQSPFPKLTTSGGVIKRKIKKCSSISDKLVYDEDNQSENSACVTDNVETGMERVRSARLRIMTSKGAASQEQIRKEHCDYVEREWRNLKSILLKLVNPPNDLIELRQLEKLINKNVKKYERASADLLGFLVRSNDPDAQEFINAHKAGNEIKDSMIEQSLTKIDSLIENGIESASIVSSSKISSHKSKAYSVINEMLVTNKAKANAAKVKATFVQKEVEMIREKADLEARMLLLNNEMEVATAEAQVSSLERLIIDHPDVNDECFSLPLPQDDVHVRTQKYVDTHVHMDTHAHVTCSMSTPVNPYNFTSNSLHQATDLSQYFLRKELLLSRLTQFDDKAQSYAIWRVSFKSIMDELKVSPMAEMDMLVKWLGRESIQHATSIRASNVKDPAKGLARLWKRLDERFGCPELVEAALKEKLSLFPRLY